MQIQISHMQNDLRVYFPCWTKVKHTEVQENEDGRSKKIQQSEEQGILHNSRSYICNANVIKMVYGWLGIFPLLPRIIHFLWAAYREKIQSYAQNKDVLSIKRIE